MNQLSIFLGSLRYEFRMQIRRRPLWITFIVLGLFFTQFHIWNTPRIRTAADMVIFWTGVVQTYLAVAVGVLLADRLVRDRRTKVEELFNALPCTLSARILGKYLGCTLATLVPMFTIYSLGVGYIVYHQQDIQILPLALVTFAAIALPGILFVAAFSLACPVILWVPLYQFLFIGYWFWGNLLPPGRGIPTLSNTILTPLGDTMLAGFYGESGLLIKHATALQGVESILLLLGLAALALFVLWRYLLWQQAQQ